MVKTISNITVFDSKLFSIVQPITYMLINFKQFEWNEHLNVTINTIHALKYHTLLMKVCS